MEKLNLKYEVIQRSEVANYADIVPTNQVPALVCEDQIITEGAAIVLFLLEKHSPYFNNLALNKRAKFYQMLMFNYATLHPAYSRVLAILRTNKDADPKLLQKLADKISELWKIVDNHLANNEFMFDGKVSIIDYLITIYAGWHRYFPNLKVEIGENSKRLARQVSKLPEFVKAANRENFKIDVQLYLE
jgi:glutathione S-transferase